MEEDFDRWYEREHAQVLAVLTVLSGDVELAREATDEAFARALERWERVAAMTSPAAWVHTVGLNCLRRTRRRARLEGALIRRRPPRSVTVDKEPDPELWEAVRRLAPRQRLAVVLRFVGDLSEPEIAEVMRISRGTVASTLADARALLRTVLADRREPREAHRD